MKILKNSKGLNLKPCLNCMPTQGRSGYFEVCPCPNHLGEIHREIEQGKTIITEFICEHRVMHEGFPGAPEKPSKPRRAKKKSRVSQYSKPKTR